MNFIKTFLCFCAFLLSIQTLLAQTTTIKGKVVDQNGLPIPGVNIKYEDTTISSDFDGNYTIIATNQGFIGFRYIGYESVKVAINNRNTINITLKEVSSNLDEVIVVGYGTQKKKVVTGSISSVKAKDLQDLPITRLEQSLQGRTAGVFITSNSGEPGQSSTIRIRGVTTFNNNEPLYVVDGVVVDAGGIGFLNQSDIESIEVLKDAASSAIYGTRAATGVILVTTKKGKAGKMNVNYSGFTGVASVIKKVDLLNARQYATLTNEANAAGNDPLPFANPDQFGEGTDWQSAIFNKNARRSSNELSISGGSDKSNFYLSFGLLDQEGLIVKDISKYNRKNIRLNSNHKLSKIFNFGQTLGYSNEKYSGIGTNNSSFGGPISSALNLDPITSIVENNTISASAPPYNQPDIIRDSNGNPYGISNYVVGENVNPFAFVQTKKGNYGWAENIVGNVFLEAEVVKNFKIRSTLGAKVANFGFESFTPRSFLNTSTITGINRIQREVNRNFGWNIENTIAYSKSFTSHNISFLLGQGAYVENDRSQSGITKSNIPVNTFQEASINFQVPDAQITAYASNGTLHKVNSLFARFNYDYKEKYLFTGIVRRDGSSRFGSDFKYGIFPSFSAGWVVSKEAFLKDNSALNFLKIRGGFGVVGNDALPDFAYTSVIVGGTNYPIGSDSDVNIGNTIQRPSNPSLRWEETSQANIGFDATFFEVLNLSFDLYNKKTTGILQDVILPGFIGASQNPIANISNMENKGFDLELGFKKKINAFTFSLNGNISYLKNEVTFLGNNVPFTASGRLQGALYDTYRTEVGQPVNSFYGFESDGIFQNQSQIDAYTGINGLIQPAAKPGDFKWRDLNNDGKITEKDRAFIGKPLPDYTFGLTFNCNYKNFDFLVFGQGVTGNQIYQWYRRLDIANTNYQSNALGRWTGEGTSSVYPRLTTEDTNENFTKTSRFYMQDGDYFRIKTVQLGYALPISESTKAIIERARFYVTGENLLTFTKYNGFDPEIGGGNEIGIDRGFYPQARTFMFGVNLQF